MSLIQQIGDILSNGWPRVLAFLLGMFLVWFMSLLPPRFRLHKRLTFALKVSDAMGKIDVSTNTKNPLSIQEVKKRLKNFLEEKNIIDINLQNDLSFKSNNSGCSYTIASTTDPDTNKNFVTLSCFKAFEVGLFGRLKKISIVIDEIGEIVDNFSDIRNGKDSLTTHITIVPRWKFMKEDKFKIDSCSKKFSATYRLKNIKLVNKGTPYLEKNIREVFYDWMTSML